MMENMRIWDAVSKTNPANTKTVNQRGGFTAINANSQIMEATRQFGPIGIGWGYTNGDPIFQGNLVIVPVTLWHGDRSNTFGPVFGCEEWIVKERVDSDAPKKAGTDGLTKCLSQLGFNADVFLGLYDDQKYVQQIKAEFANKPEPLPASVQAMIEGLRASAVQGEVAMASYWKEHWPAIPHEHRPAVLAVKDEIKAAVTAVSQLRAG